MKKAVLFSLLFACISQLAYSKEYNQKPNSDSYPLFWTWLGYDPSSNFDSICQVLKETGIDGLILNASSPENYRKAIPIANKYGIEVYAWLWTMNLEHDGAFILKEHPDWLSVNRKGQSLADTMAYVGYYKFLCPAIPEVRSYLRERIKSYCEVPGLKGISIDYHRFVDVILPTTLWPNYNVVQDKEYPEWDYGYHPAMIEKFKQLYGYDPRELEDPSTDDKWLQFRCDQITEVANEIAEVVHSYGKVMAASPFPTPAMSRQMVRQDWNKWNLDIVFPMVYHNFYTNDASFISDCMIDNVHSKNPMTTLHCGLTASDDPSFFSCMDSAFNNGAQGIALFTINSLQLPETRAAFKAYTDSIKQLKKASQNVYTSLPAVNTNPFQKPGVMKAINEKIKNYTKQTEAIVLSEFKLINTYGATQQYRVIEKKSNQPFRVSFYFYGGILSGWNVDPE